jgi:excisionase family DNA binding protein
VNRPAPPTGTDPAAGTYTVPDLAALLKCSERHVRGMAAGGAIPGVIRLGRMLRFHQVTVNDWLAARAKGVTRG